jgi:hypothetical protein
LKLLLSVAAKCTELPEAPQNGMVVAPKLDHGMVGKFECRYTLTRSQSYDRELQRHRC